MADFKMKPLAGMRVLDLTRVLAGPLCTQTLGSLGAEVIKVESCQGGDESREWPPYRKGTGTAYLAVNCNKKSLALDLKTPDGIAVIKQLVATSDIVVESNSAGAAERLGIHYEALRAIRPSLIHCSITGFGETGPLKEAKGYDLMLQAFSGLLAMTGTPGGAPARSPFSPVDQATGYHAVIGILSAVLQRSQTGEGARIEVSLFDTAVNLVGYHLQAFWETGDLPQRIGCEHPSLVPYQPFNAADRPILIGIANDNLWQRFCKAFGVSELAEDPRFKTNKERVVRRAETVNIVQKIVGVISADDLLARLLEIGVPCSPLNTLKDLSEHAHTQARHMIVEYDHPMLGLLKTVAPPMSFDGRRADPGLPPPLLGEHTASILQSLGYDQARINSMSRAGVIRLQAESTESR